jgi:2-methylisocitrate lyase-like PEP mutase family enzyme
MTSKPPSTTTLKALHIPGTPILFTNVWDTLSVRAIAPLPSCKALATASYAIALAANTTDDALTYEENLHGIRAIAKVAHEYGKPLTADIQDAYGDRLEEAIGALLGLDVAGCNLEDYDNANGRMYSEDEAAARVERTMAVARERGAWDFVVHARCDSLHHGGDLAEVIRRGQAYLAAGATAVFVWGGKRGVSGGEVRKLVEAFQGRLSVKLDFEGLSVKQLAEIGVARVSVGPSMQTRMMKALAQDAETLLSC